MELREKSPLKGKRILITRPGDQAEELIARLNTLGAEPILFPTIRIVPPKSWEEVDKAIDSLLTYDTIIFTSVNGVKKFFQRLQEKGKDSGSFGKATICAIGPSTASEIEKFNLRADIVPEKFQAEFVVDSLERHGIAGKRFLLPRAEKAREVLPDEIKKRRGHIDVVTVYRTTKGEGNVEEVRELFQKGSIDVITFTSSSTVNNFVDLLGKESIAELINGCVVAAIGPITAETAGPLGIKTDVMAKEYTIPGLVEAMKEYFRDKSVRREA